ncbi:strictosidine synthase [Rhizobium sp.]
MIGAIRRAWDNFRGAGEAAVTVPPMDGALRPNRLLEDAPEILGVATPDDIVTDGKVAYIAAGHQVLRLDLASRQSAPAHSYDAEITALALSASGVLAVALADDRIVLENRSAQSMPVKLRCVTAMTFTGEQELAVTQGSETRSASEWKRDLMERAATGSVHSVDLKTGSNKRLATGLGWPYGIVKTADGQIVVAESWKNRLLVIGGDGTPKPLLGDLPGYPARLSPAKSGGYWLSVFAPRNQIIEFIQREPEFLRRMMTDIEPDYWAAPTLKPSATFLEPLQGGAQKHFGQLKPWAPSRSYGLVVHLDRNFRPTAGYHSRADGRHHGATSAVETPHGVLVASKGGDAVLLLDPSARSVAREQLGEH